MIDKRSGLHRARGKGFFPVLGDNLGRVKGRSPLSWLTYRLKIHRKVERGLLLAVLYFNSLRLHSQRQTLQGAGLKAC